MNHRDDDLQELPSFTPESDELNARRTQQFSNDLLLDTPANTGGSSAFVWLLFLLVLVIGVRQAFLYVELSKSNERIATLEQRLSQAGESMDQSSATMGLRLKELTDKTNELWTQMDKLWASAWRRNQSDIATLGDDIKGLNKTSLAIKASISELEKSVAGVPGLEKRVKELAGLQAQIDKAVTTGNSVANKIGGIEASIAKLQGSNAGLDKRVATNEQWVESINAYRKQINRRLDDLQSAIAPTATTAPSLN